MQASIKRFLEIAVVLTALCTTYAGAACGPPTDADCVDDKPFADPDNCTCSYQCFDIGGSLVLTHDCCPPGGHFDAQYGSCNAGECTNPTGATNACTTTDSSTDESTTESESSTDTSTDSSTDSSSEDNTTTESSTEVSTSSSTDGQTTDVPTIGPPTFTCASEGYFSHPTDPAKYYRCLLVGAQFYYYVYPCPPNSCWQQGQTMCVVGSCPKTNSTATTTTLAPPTGSGNSSTPIPATTLAPVIVVCNTAGLFPYPGSTTKYYNCLLLEGTFVHYVFECPPKSYFDVGTSLCTTGEAPVTKVTAATTPTTKATVITTKPGTTAAPYFPCPNEGYFMHPTDCFAYYRCLKVNGVMYRYVYQCPKGSAWSGNVKGCLVGPCQNPPTGMPTISTSANTEATTLKSEMTSGSSATSDSSATSEEPISSVSESDSTTPTSFSCTQVGVFTDPNNCSRYNRCITYNGKFYYYLHSCPPNFYFDTTTTLCTTGSCS